MKKHSLLVVVALMLLFMSVFVRTALAEESNGLKLVLSKDLVGISFTIHATNATVPGGNISVNLWTQCTAMNVTVNSFNMSVHGFHEDLQETQLTAENIMENRSLAFNSTNTYTSLVVVPEDVWGVTFIDLQLEYHIYYRSFEYAVSRPATTIKNIYYEQLNETFRNLNESFTQLNSSYEQLNQTYWDLKQNFTTLQGSIGDLESTRQLAVILGITTVVFVATTLYVIIRKPKQYW